MSDDFIYPDRKKNGKIFALQVIRLLAKSRAADEIGTIGLAMVSQIAVQEDSCHYTKPVTFWNASFMADLGIRSDDTFAKARDNCIKAGWLKYSSGGKRKAGAYYVTIPDGLESLDGSIDDGLDLKIRVNSRLEQDYSRNNDRLEQDYSRNSSGLWPEQSPIIAVTKPDPFFPIPIPIPSPIPSPIPNPNIPNTSVVPSEPEIQKPKKVSKKDLLVEDFERFWTSTSYPKRKPSQDNKAAILKKYIILRNAGRTYEDIAEAAEIFAEANKPADQYTIGLRAFMEEANISQWLNGDIAQGHHTKSRKEMSFEERIVDNLKDFDFSKYEIDHDDNSYEEYQQEQNKHNQHKELDA
jgi:hypothetical protein